MLKIASCQLKVGIEKSLNLSNAQKMVFKAADLGCELVILPECFNSPYGTQYFNDYAETIPDGQSSNALSKMAQESKCWIIGGSIPEKHLDKLYNTLLVFNPAGELVAKHRKASCKVHLFDINIPNKIKFMESEVLSPGNQLTQFEMKFTGGTLNVGLGICYDLRFPELAMIAARRGCKLMVYPGAFNMTTGPLHWELLQRARALDNQIFVATASPARDETASYTAWGNSTITNPSGIVIAKAGANEELLVADIDLNEVDEIRRNIPLDNQRRFDLYTDVSK